MTYLNMKTNDEKHSQMKWKMKFKIYLIMKKHRIHI